MDDFEYSVQISESDWDAFIRECEECALPPPAEAGADDSDVSDIDDVGSTLLVDAGLETDTGAVFLEPGRPIDAPLGCEGSPVERRLSKHSGRREDAHLGPVNRFFERLSSLTGAEQLIELSQMAAGETTEAVWAEEVCTDGQHANSTALPINIPERNPPPPSCEKETGEETRGPHSSGSTTTTTTDTAHTDGPRSKMAPEIAVKLSEGETDKSISPYPELVIREEDWLATPGNEASRRRKGGHARDAPCGDEQRRADVSVTVLKKGPYLDKKPPVKLDVIHCDNSAEGKKGLSVVLPVKDPGQQSDTRVPSQELSPPFPSQKKKKRKKRASIEPVEVGCGYERQFHANQSDSEEDRSARGTETNPRERLSVECGAACMDETERERFRLSAQQNVENTASASPPSCSEGLQGRPYGKVASDYQNQRLSEESDQIERPLLSESPSQTDYSDLSTPNDGGHVETNLQPCSASPSEASVELKESPGLSVSGTASHHSESARGNHSTPHREAEPQQEQDMDEDYKNMEALAKVFADYNPSPKHDPLVMLEDIDCVIGSDTPELPTPIKIHREFKNGHSSSPCENPTEVASTDAAVESIKLSLPEKNYGFNEPFISEPDKINRTKYRDDQFEYQSNIKADLTVYTESYKATVSAKSLLTVDLEGSLNSHHSNEIIDTNIDNSVPDRNHSSSKDGLFSLSGSSLLNSSSCEVSQNAGLAPNRTHLTVRPGTNDTDVPTKSSDSPGTTDLSELGVYSHVTSVEGTVRAKKSKVAEKAPDSKQSVYAMSSFWKDIEKLTIKDILRVRMVCDGQPPGALPQPLDREVTDTSDAADSGYFTHPDDSKPDRSSGDMSTIADFDGDSNPNSDPIVGDESTNSIDILWESDPDPVCLGAGMYPDNAMLSATSDLTQSLLPSSAQKHIRKINKNRSTQNLQALESSIQSLTGCILPTVIAEEKESEMESFRDEHMPRRDSALDSQPSSSSFTDDVRIEKYRISLTDIFQYIFGGTTSEPCHSDTDMSAYYVGNSVPETYDHFYSEYEAGNFFFPVVEEDNTKYEGLPIFSCSRPASRSLQFPEAYEHFFPSSSSNDSSMESDEGEERAPIQVVTRSAHKDSEIQDGITGPDMYEHFFPDGHLGGNIFGRNYFSLRNARLTGSTSHRLRSASQSLIPVNQSRNRKSVWRTIQPLDTLGYQDRPFPDPLLYKLEDRIRQLAMQPLRCDDLQIAVANPRCDASLLPLKQSDMCLVCIAFASWVLKSANPQAEDAWKAVLLANISALSAIRYLRRYGKEEVGEETIRHSSSV